MSNAQVQIWKPTVAESISTGRFTYFEIPNENCQNNDLV